MLTLRPKTIKNKTTMAELTRRNPIATALIIYFGANAIGLINDLITFNIELTDIETASTTMAIGMFVWTIIYLLRATAAGALIFRPQVEITPAGRIGAFGLTLISAFQLIDTILVIFTRTDLFSGVSPYMPILIPAASAIMIIAMTTGLNTAPYLKVTGAITCVPNIISILLLLGIEQSEREIIIAASVISLILYIAAITASLIWARSSPSAPDDQYDH